MTGSFRTLAAWTACILLVFTIDGAAQTFSLSGTVRDAVGVVPAATVTLSSGAPQVQTAQTNGEGTYRFNGLSAGTYEVTFDMLGFETVTRTVLIGANTAPLDVVLAVGRVSTTVSVVESAGKATSTRLPVPDDEIPAQVTSIPQELLQQQGSNSVVEALKNASGVQAFRWYGVYEYYTIRGFNQADVMLIDGMRLEGNRFSTQTNNIQSVEILKGPSSIVYGGGATGGAINIVRKKPEASPAYDFSYRGGRFNTHQVTGGATGPMGRSNTLYRVDASYEHADGWRNAGSDRLNVSPSLTVLMGESARLTVHQAFNRDRFDGDGGVPLNITTLPNFKPEVRFSLPQDNVLIEDSQSNILFNANLASWEFRNSLLIRRTSDRYFVTEGIYGDPENNEVFREPLDFHHFRRPVQNQTEVVGRLNGFGRHTLLAGYEYQLFKTRTDVTAGDDPDCTCGYWWIDIAPMNIDTLQETNPELDIDTIARKTYQSNRIHAFYFQDQIDVLPQLKINIGGRFDDYKRHQHRLFTDDPGVEVGIQDRNQTAFTYRAGAVYAPVPAHQVYFSTSTAFSPVTTIPADGSELKPRTARNYEVGHRWQGWDGRVDTNLAAYYIVQNNLNVRQSVTTFIQVGEQTSQGIDLDINTDLGARTHLILNYGFTQPKFEEAEALTGKMPRYSQKHAANAWLRKDWAAGFNASIGARYLGPQYANNNNTIRIGGYTIFSGAVGFHADRWDWSLNAENLFNRERYFIPGHFDNLVFPGQPINITSTIRFRFN